MKKSKRVVYDYAKVDRDTRSFSFRDRTFESKVLESREKITALDSEVQWKIALFFHDIATHLERCLWTSPLSVQPQDAIVRTARYNKKGKVVFYGALTKNNTVYIDSGIAYRPTRALLQLNTQAPNWLEQFDEWKTYVMDMVQSLWDNLGEIVITMSYVQYLNATPRLSIEPWMYEQEPNGDYLARLKDAMTPYLSTLSYVDEGSFGKTYFRSMRGEDAFVVWERELITIQAQQQGKTRTVAFGITEDGLTLHGEFRPKKEFWLEALMTSLKRVMTRPATFVASGYEPLPSDVLQITEPVITIVEKETILCGICMHEPRNKIWNCQHTYCASCSGRLVVCSYCKEAKQYEKDFFI